ncbi:MAG TPA: sigma factor [Pseudonocardiaceae bacterium]|nr:sigma factor [Pseudonocardiaceae bacterium]
MDPQDALSRLTEAGTMAWIEDRCRRRVPQVDVDDVVSDTVLRACQSLLHRQEPIRTFDGWLAAVVDNAIATYWRSAKPVDPVSDVPEGDPSPPAEHSLLFRDVRLLLDPADREVLPLYLKLKDREISQQDVAARLGFDRRNISRSLSHWERRVRDAVVARTFLLNPGGCDHLLRARRRPLSPELRAEIVDHVHGRRHEQCTACRSRVPAMTKMAVKLAVGVSLLAPSGRYAVTPRLMRVAAAGLAAPAIVLGISASHLGGGSEEAGTWQPHQAMALSAHTPVPVSASGALPRQTTTTAPASNAPSRPTTTVPTTTVPTSDAPTTTVPTTTVPTTTVPGPRATLTNPPIPHESAPGTASTTAPHGCRQHHDRADDGRTHGRGRVAGKGKQAPSPTRQAGVSNADIAGHA